MRRNRSLGARAAATSVLFMLIVGLMPVAAEDTDDEPVQLALVSEVGAIQPGVPFTVALRIEHGPGFHTYWKKPGIVGVATSLLWDLPEGFEAGPIQWPQPEVVKMGVINAHGYEKETFLLVDITPPDSLDDAKVTLKARAVYMACAVTCHPGFDDFELTLPVSGDRAGSPDWKEPWHAAFEAARATFPVEPSGWNYSWSDEGKVVRLRLEPAPGGGEAEKPNLDVGDAHFFSTDNQVDSDAAQKVMKLPGGGIEFEMVRAFYGPSDVKSLKGVLYTSRGWLQNGGAKSIIINASLSDSGGEKR